MKRKQSGWQCITKMNAKIYYIIFFLLAFVLTTEAQISSFNVGGSIHVGSIAGNSPSVTSLGGTVFFDFYPWFEHDVSFRFGYSYSQKAEQFIPENRAGRYYPFIKVLSLKGFIRQDLSFPIYIEEGAGIIYLNNRTFPDVNNWQVGTSFSASVGYDFRKIDEKGFCMNLGLDYGVTFTQTTANYFLVFLQGQYYF